MLKVQQKKVSTWNHSCPERVEMGLTWLSSALTAVKGLAPEPEDSLLLLEGSAEVVAPSRDAAELLLVGPEAATAAAAAGDAPPEGVVLLLTGESFPGPVCCAFFPFLDPPGLVWMRKWRVSSSERLKRLTQPWKVQAWGFSPVWVRMCRVWCSSR